MNQYDLKNWKFQRQYREHGRLLPPDSFHEKHTGDRWVLVVTVLIAALLLAGVV